MSKFHRMPPTHKQHVVNELMDRILDELELEDGNAGLVLVVSADGETTAGVVGLKKPGSVMREVADMVDRNSNPHPIPMGQNLPFDPEMN